MKKSVKLSLMSAALGLGLSASASYAANSDKAATTPAAVSAPATKLTLTNKLVDGKKVWEPETVNAKAGETLEITLVNTLTEPHGFSAPGLLSSEVVVGGKETKSLTVKPSKAGSYKFHCQLHPAHVGGVITVQ